MTNITVLLLVLTLTGSPVVSVACFAWCHQGPAAHGHCQDGLGASSGPVIDRNVKCTDPAIVADLFPGGHRASSEAAAVLPASSAAAGLTAMAERRVAATTTVQGWSRPPIVLRI